MTLDRTAVPPSFEGPDRGSAAGGALLVAGPARGPLGGGRRLPAAGVVAAGGVLGLAVIAALGAGLLATDPGTVDLGAVLAGPSAAHPLGVDQQGRDLFARLAHGARPSLLIPILVVATSTIAGTALGLAAGWRRGALDALISRTLDLTLALPGILLALVLAARLGPGPTGPAIAIAIWLTPATARLVRTATIDELPRPYVASYRLHGWGPARIAVLGLLPNLAGLVLARAALDVGRAMVALGSLSFLGVGVVPPAADWGAMVNEGRDALLQGALLPTVVPAVTLLAVVVAVGVLGDAIGRRLDGRGARA